ncbi:MAG TPA: 3-oxoacyl-[acyl-carrier-protein] reductase [Clostridiales bacterium]|jgi:3-oxoacyl-[acyl-carrier protein] reductase|nr:3-oxoacyl-[acyl-carrier-protein] reductase [Clostridiales bacterium]
MNNKTAIITGASGGLGCSIAKKLNENNYNLVLNYNRNSSSLEELINNFENKDTKNIIVQGDVSSYTEAEKLIKVGYENFDKIDLLVNNAGITKDKLLTMMSEEDFQDVIRVNLNGTFNCIRHISKKMIRQKEGKIVNISSVIGLTGNIGQANYAASKAGVIGLTKSVAKELARKNITCNVITPGFIETDMTKVLEDNQIKNIKNQIPLKRLGTPEDVANLIVFLSSDFANYITGQVISVDGGLYM